MRTTREHAHEGGLPPGPLGATTLDSLLAALKPEKNPYWYYPARLEQEAAPVEER